MKKNRLFSLLLFLLVANSMFAQLGKAVREILTGDSTVTHTTVRNDSDSIRMANMKRENENFPFPVPSCWRISTMSVWTISPDAPISRKIPTGSPLQTMPCWCCKNTPPSPNATRAGWSSFSTPSPNNRLSKKKHDRPCEIAKSVPSQTIRFFSFRISTT